MSFSFEIGKLKSSNTGLSYVNKFDYTGSSTTKTYTSETFAYANSAIAMILPQVNIPASLVPEFPTVTTSVSNSQQKITVSASGGNINSTILVFVR